MRWCVTATLLLLVVPAFAQKQTGSRQWPSFRGNHASGVADGQNLPEQWDAEKGTNIRWKTRIPGLSHSSPVVWGDQRLRSDNRPGLGTCVGRRQGK